MRLNFRTLGLAFLTLVVATAIITASSKPSLAQEAAQPLRHETRFNVSLGNLVLGQMNFQIDANGSEYVLHGTGRTKGIAEWFAAGNAKIKSSGTLTPSKAIANKHFISITERKKTATLDMTMKDGEVIQLAMKPDKSKRHLDKKRVTITEQEFKNIIDPASTLVIPVPEKTANNPHSVCGQLFRVYDGEARYNMQLSYKRNAKITTAGYDGYAYVCRLKYIPVAGHRPSHANTKRMAANNDMELWLAPVQATSLFTPIRIIIPTWLGKFYAEPLYFGPKS